MVKLSRFGLCFFTVLACLFHAGAVMAQSTVTTGNWSDGTVWSGGAVPAAAGTVTVSNPLTIDQNLGPSGTWTFNSNATDPTDGTPYTFNPTGGTTTIAAGVTVTFEGTSNLNGAKIDIFGTLILGATQISNNAGNNIIVEPGGTLIINGDLTDKDNSGAFTVNGDFVVNGNLDCQTGSIVLTGGGTIYTTGTIASNGGSTIFGSTNDCTAGPCSGSNLNCTFTNHITPAGPTVICSGSGTGTLTAVTNGASPTYQWKVSTTSATTGFSNITGATSSTFSATGLTQNTWYRVGITSGGCNSSSGSVAFTVLPSAGGWVGTTSADWNDFHNWCSLAVPTIGTDVTIAKFAAGAANNYPNISTATANAQNLVISSGATVTLSAGQVLNLSANFTNNGTFTDNGGTTQLVGATAQTISGSSPITLNSLTISNAAGVSLTSNNFMVKGTLTMSAGEFNLNGFTMTHGVSAVSTGTLTYTSGILYGGNITRWFPTSAITVGTANGLFPIGVTGSYRPIYFGNAGLTAGGTIKVSHTGITGATGYVTPFVDNGGTVSIHSNSFWTVSTGNGLGTGTHNLRTEANNIGGVGDVTDLRQTLLTGIAPGADGAHNGSLTVPQVNRTGLTTANLTNSFYWGSVNVTRSTLPIKLSKFTGAPALDGVQLRWTTQSEENADNFVLERSDEGDAFFPIATIKAHGTTATVSNYSYLDAGVVGRNYYRLRSVDFDGRYEYSQAIVVDAGVGGFALYPNPVTDRKLSIKLGSDEPGTLMMIDCTGKLLMNQNFSDYHLQVVLPESTQSGIYFMKLQQGASQKTIRVAVIN